MMGLTWIVWALIILISFALLEGYALKHPQSEWTLSHSLAWLGMKWPLTLFLSGLIVGGLAVHFFGTSWNCATALGPQ